MAIFRRARETGAAEKWSSEMALLSAFMGDERIRLAEANPNVSRAQFSDAFLGLCGERLDDEGRNFVRLLIQNRRLAMVADITRLYEEYRAEDEGYIDVDVISAFELTAEDNAKLAATLNKILGKKSRLTVSVDEQLIGGVYIRAGDKVIDASIRGRIERLAKSLMK